MLRDMSRGTTIAAMANEPAAELRTFLFADIRGYTRFTRERGDGAAAELAARFAALAREGVAARGGRVVELRGDEALAVFGSARQALYAAVELQARFARETLANPSLPLSVGIGVDAGEAVPVEGGYRGGALNLAARLCSLAELGEVLASEGVVHLARKIEGLSYVEREPVYLKGFEDPVRVVQVIAEQPDPLIGRRRERGELERALAAAREGQGGLLLLAGEAGVGKTRLAEETLGPSGLLLLSGPADQEATPPYGPIVAALRSYLRVAPDGLRDCGPLAAHLAMLLPELGPAPDGGDRSALFEAIRCAFGMIARRQPVAVFLDDLHWADNTTLELLGALAGSMQEESLLIVGAYRSDEIPRGHPVRRLRTDLRRAGRLHEVSLEALDREETAALAARVLGRIPSAALAAALYDRTQGVPFFIEEHANALLASGRLVEGKGGLELVGGENVPLPDTVRDAVLLRCEGLSDGARDALQVAAVVGLRFDLGLVAELAGGEQGIEEAMDRGLLIEAEPDGAAFRHALAREALYGDVSWGRRRALHREVAARLEARRAQPGLVAEHWLAARETEHARRALLAACEASCAVHAYRDALQSARRALDLWPERTDEAGRLNLLDRLGQCAELCGDLPEAARAWREVADGRHLTADASGEAEVQRRLATVYELQGAWEVYELQGAWERALAAREAAAELFARCDQPGEAAAERLAVASHLQSAGSYSAGLPLVQQAAVEAERADRPDLQARALGLEGAIRAKLGEIEAGLALVQAGLSLALEHDLTAAAVEVYQRLGTVMENDANYLGARDAYVTAYGYCEAKGVPGMAQLCLGCLCNILRQTGEWERAVTLARDVLAFPNAPLSARMAAGGELGLILAFRGEAKRARALLVESGAQARQLESTTAEINCGFGLAWIDELDGAVDVAADRCRFILQRWEQTEDRHYSIPAVRWAASFLARQGIGADTRAGAQALSRIATATANAEALAALAHSLGEIALLEGDPHQAAVQFGQALELLRDLELPFERAQTELRAGVALAAAGEREAGVERLIDAYRTARKLGAQPFASRVAQELAALGEPVERHLGRRAAGQLERGGLSRRELEILRLIAAGRTNREVAHELFLSPRTVDMHARNILAKLDCRSRTEATHKAGELGLV